MSAVGGVGLVTGKEVQLQSILNAFMGYKENNIQEGARKVIKYSWAPS